MKFLVSKEDLKLEGEYNILYFYATWLNEHKKMMTMLSKMEDKYSINFYGINVDEFKLFCKVYSIYTIPTIVILKDKKEIRRITGVVMTSALKNSFYEMIKLNKADIK